MIVHSFQGVGSSLKASVLQISAALDSAMPSEKSEKTEVVSKLKNLVGKDQKPKPSTSDDVVKLLNEAIQSISKSHTASGQEQGIKSYSKGL